MRIQTPLMRAAVIGMIAVLTLAVLAVPRSEAQAQDYLTELGTALGGWATPYADFAEKGQELLDDVTVVFNTEWQDVWSGDLAAFDSVAAAVGAVSLPSDADATLAGLVGEIATDTSAETATIQTAMDDLDADAIAAGYAAIGAIDAKVTEAIALVEASGGTVAPGDTGNAGLAAAAGSNSAATFGVLALFALALVGGARLVVVRSRSE
jgi:hypothetical protein